MSVKCVSFLSFEDLLIVLSYLSYTFYPTLYFQLYYFIQNSLNFYRAFVTDLIGVVVVYLLLYETPLRRNDT